MKFTFRKGLDIAIGGAPEQRLRDGQSAASVAILGEDYPGIRPDYRVAEGERVRAGQVLFVDRKRPQICFTAPAAGVVERIDIGPRRTIGSLVIRIEGDDFETLGPASGATDRHALRDLLQRSGLWTSFRTRPFGRVPDPVAVPAAIFVTALETDPLTGDAAVILEPHLPQFRRAVEALTLLTDGSVFVCQSPGIALASESQAVRTATFAGPHPAGLPGTHIHHLMPASARRTVWHVGYQDVAAIGHLLETGRLWTERTVALAGPGVRQPGLVRTRMGASLEELVAAETLDGAVRPVSGSVLSGREAAYLGRYHTQVTVLPRGRPVMPRSTLGAVFGWMPRADTGPTIPIESLDEVMPLDILPVPLMRALSIGDVETAERLGCLELVEEDVTLLSHLCPGQADYGALLRQALDELETE
ncbi:MAG: NADH:ubiquinone reductase (Na(+)-transporting) subunit A [Rhizobiaceae bacterium]